MQVDVQLLALICGHFLGDFILQTDRLAARKAKGIKWLLLHVLLVATVTWILLGNLAAWWIAGVVLILHLLVDSFKLGRSGGLFRFIGDQSLHVVSLIVLWQLLDGSGWTSPLRNHWVASFGMDYTNGLLFLTGLTVGVWGIGVLLKYQMAEFADKLDDKVRQGLPKGGRTIGILERLLVFMFVFAGQPEGVGFVIAAKSVFRIGEFTNKHDRDHAEYIMIGTLRSFTYALVIAFMTRWLIG